MPSFFKAVIEPTVIASIFTAGCVINRRRVVSPANQPSDLECSLALLTPEEQLDDYHGLVNSSSSGVSSSSSSPPLKPVFPPSAVEVDGLQERRLPLFWDLLSRFWNKFPFLQEIWYWNLTYWIYQLLRAFSARSIAGKQPIFDLARVHALQVLSFEKFLSIDFELGFQRHLLTNYPDWMLTLARIYHSHICIGVAFIVYSYTYVPRSAFYRIRRTIALDNVMSFFIITVWRCSPPRLLPPEYGYVDVLHKNLSTHDNAWTNNRFQLTIAAMPSLHFGTALFFAVCLFRFAPHRVVRMVALLWPFAMLVTIMATANHFLLDAVVGALIPSLSWRFAHWMGKVHWIEVVAFSPFWKRMMIEEEDNFADKDVGESKRVD